MVTCTNARYCYICYFLYLAAQMLHICEFVGYYSVIHILVIQWFIYVDSNDCANAIL
jgi:hypothetical protein